jgi:hypothetical protein
MTPEIGQGQRQQRRLQSQHPLEQQPKLIRKILSLFFLANLSSKHKNIFHTVTIIMYLTHLLQRILRMVGRRKDSMKMVLGHAHLPLENWHQF